jgi:hypothetical protein
MKPLASSLLYINICWYIVLAVAFVLAGEYAKGLYFTGAAILTVGVALM